MVIDAQDPRSPARAGRSLILAAVATALMLSDVRPGSARGDDASPTASKTTVSRSLVRALGRLEPASGLIAVGRGPASGSRNFWSPKARTSLPMRLSAILEGHDQHERQLALAVAQQKSAEFRRRVRRDDSSSNASGSTS